MVARNRDKAPDLFDRELDDAIEALGRNVASLPVFVTRSGHAIRRYLMPKTRCHLYLELNETRAEVRVLAAAGGQRRRPPRIRLQDAP